MGDRQMESRPQRTRATCRLSRLSSTVRCHANSASVWTPAAISARESRHLGERQREREGGREGGGKGGRRGGEGGRWESKRGGEETETVSEKQRHSHAMKHTRVPCMFVTNTNTNTPPTHDLERSAVSRGLRSMRIPSSVSTLSTLSYPHPPPFPFIPILFL
jgi:hypothetical protein